MNVLGLLSSAFTKLLGGWKKTLLLAIVLYVLFAGHLNLLTLFFQPDQQISYKEDWTAFDCIRPDFCFMEFTLTIGNTGNQMYERVAVHNEHVPPSMAIWSKKVLSLDSDFQDAKNAPKIQAKKEGQAVVAIISRFPPGTIIEIVYMDQHMPRETADSLRGIEDYVRVEAPGQILEGSPHAAAFARYIRTFFGLAPSLSRYSPKTPMPLPLSTEAGESSGFGL